MKVNYPIKYSIMPIIEQTGWTAGLNELEREYNITCYIVSKCYVVGENKKYNADGTMEETYEVVFPYDLANIENSKIKRVIPAKNFYSQFINTKIVNNVYNSFDEAKADAEKANEEMFIKSFMYMPLDKIKNDYDRLKQEHANKISFYELYENEIEEKTTDLINNKKVLRQELIMVLEDEDKIVNMSLYDYIKLYRRNYIVCTVTDKEFDDMKQQIKRDRMLDEKLSNPNYQSYNRFNYLLYSSPNNDIIRVANTNKEECGSFYIDENEVLQYDENYKSFDKNTTKQIGMHTKIYTTETRDDIIESYREKETIKVKRKNKRD